MFSEGLDKLWRAAVVLLALAAGLGAGMVAVGVIAEVALENTLAHTYNVYVDWHNGQRLALALDIAATVVLTVLTIVVTFATRRVSVRRGQVIAGLLAAALVFACVLPSIGWFWLIFQDGLPSDREFIMDTYGGWYYPLIGVFGLGYALAAACASVLLILPRPELVVAGDRPADGQSGS